MLYARLLQKGHVYELTHAFGLLLTDPHNLHGATVYDVGCGPFTTGLALANVSGPDVVFRYFGIDISRSMCALGAELADAAKLLGGLSPATSVQFFHPDDAIDFGPPRAGWTIVVLSYLLASPTIDVGELSQQIVAVCNRIGVGPVALLYTNSAREGARATFPEFQRHMEAAGFIPLPDETEWLTDGDRPRHIHYALFHRLNPPPIPLSAFRP